MKVMGRKVYWLIIILNLMWIGMGCGESLVGEKDSGQNEEQLNLEAILRDMVLIPAGEFIMGSPDGEGAYDEHPQHTVYLDAFYIDKYEVTNAQFKEFIEATGYVTYARQRNKGLVWNPKELSKRTLRAFTGVNWQYPYAWRKNEGHPNVWENHIVDRGRHFISMYLDINHPVVEVSWNDAQAYAKWAGKRLPTEAEWEKAASGTDGRKWPWGNVFDLDIKGITAHANIASNVPMLVDSFPTGVSPYGAYNMAGNVQEWCADWYAADYYAHSPKNNPKGPDNGIGRVLRGGSWRHQKSYQVLSTNRAYREPTYRTNFIGFRCAWSQ